MSADIWGALGIIVALVVGVPAYFAVKKRVRQRQTQRVGEGGMGIQAGRDINLGEPK